jgi:hypothetical protein
MRSLPANITMPLTSPDTWNILRPQLEFLSKPFPCAAVEFASSHRDEVAPHLIEALTQIVSVPAIANDDNYLLHLYALYLLAAWRDTRAYAPMIALGYLSEANLDLVLGDLLTDGYERCLASVCDGDVQPLQALFEDTQASHWARMAGLDAIRVRVLEGDYAREDLVAYLAAQGDAQAVRLRLPDTVRHEIDLLDCVVNVACDIAAQEIRERIDSWFDEGLLNSGLKDQPNVQRLLGRSFDDLAIHASGSGKGYVSDAVKEMAWWTVFAPERIAAPALTHGALPAAELHRQSIQPPAYIPVRVTPKIGRNDTCTCGSGKKYKKCCGA